MNVLFFYSLQNSIDPIRPLKTQEQIHFGISYISSLLKKHGHKTKLFVANRETSKRQIERYLNDFRPNMVCFTAIATEYQFIVDLASHIKKGYPDIFLLIGGVHVSLNPDATMLDIFDAICIGEGEYPTLELVEHLQKSESLTGIANLWVKNGSKIIKKKARPFLQQIDYLPFPDREMWQEWIGGFSSHSILLGRGCPYNCTYCCNHALRKLSKGQYIRLRSADNILDEIRELTIRFQGVENIYMEVETITIKIDWAIELCSKLKIFNSARERPLSFSVNFRVNPYRPNNRLGELFAALKDSNFHFIDIGLESGNEKIRREVLKRNYSNDDFIKTVELAREYGLRVSFYNLIGIPGETLDDFKETVNLNRKLLPDWHALSIFYPYPGTDLHRLCKEKGLLKEAFHDTEMERCKATLDLPGFSKKQIQKEFIWFDYNVYKGQKPFYKLIAKVAANKLNSSYRLYKFYALLNQLAFFEYFKKILAPKMNK